jgi:hypothetical protein
MKRCLAVATILSIATSAQAEPIKCVVAGKTIYTDDPKQCGAAKQQTIHGNVSTFPEVTPLPTATPAPSFTSGRSSGNGLSSLLPDFLLRALGISRSDLNSGMKTIEDARQQGSWQSPQMPEDAR